MPALSHDRVALNDEGRVRIQLRTPWNDGTTHLTLDSLAFCARLAALIPRPRKELLAYHGVRATNARVRPSVVALARPKKPATPTHDETKRLHRAWAELKALPQSALYALSERSPDKSPIISEAFQPTDIMSECGLRSWGAL